MAKAKTRYSCRECGGKHHRWLGRCPDCNEWDSLEEFTESKSATISQTPASLRIQAAKPIGEISADTTVRMPVGLGEVDRVLGGGLVPGSGILLAGEPGIGKSTLLLQISQNISKDKRFLYVTGEEGAAQVKMRADRLGTFTENLFLLADTDLDRILDQIQKVKPAAIGIDSVQVLRSAHVPSAAGSVTQVREVTGVLLEIARISNCPIILVGHVTKDGSVAGPRVLEHLVDAVLSFEGERTDGLRILRALKNRFGSTQEVGLFEMRSGGLRQVEDPDNLLLPSQQSSSPGSAIGVIVEGSRPLLLEIQALVCSSSYGTPARRASGLDTARLQMLSAVFEKRLQIPLMDRDIYANVVGGVKVHSTCADLALAAALLSSIRERPITEKRVFAGEIGLLGEIRSVSSLPRRLEAAARLGFTSAVIPRGALSEKRPPGLEILAIDDLSQLIEVIT